MQKSCRETGDEGDVQAEEVGLEGRRSRWEHRFSEVWGSHPQLSPLPSLTVSAGLGPRRQRGLGSLKPGLAGNVKAK